MSAVAVKRIVRALFNINKLKKYEDEKKEIKKNIKNNINIKRPRPLRGGGS